MLPTHYAQLVTDEDIRELNSRIGSFTLSKRFVKDDGGYLGIREPLSEVN